MARMADHLAALATMSPAQLRAEWRRVHRALPPEVPLDILRRSIAHRLQEKAYGGLPTATARELDRIVARLAKSEAALIGEMRLKPGTRLVRRWQGTTYTVTVVDDGYVFDDRRFTSLSQIAEAITGAHWSGPRFFGTTRRAGEKRPAAGSRAGRGGRPGTGADPASGVADA